MGNSTEAKQPKVKSQPRRSTAPAIKPALIDHRTVAAMLGNNVKTWLSRVQAGTAPLPHSRMGRYSYYRARDVEHFIDRGTWPEGTKFRRGE